MTDITKEELAEAELLFLNSDRKGDKGVTHIQEYKLRFEWEKRMGSLVYVVSGAPIDLAKKIGKDRPQTREKGKSYCGPYRLVDEKKAPAKEAEDAPDGPATPRRGRLQKAGGE